MRNPYVAIIDYGDHWRAARVYQVGHRCTMGSSMRGLAVSCLILMLVASALALSGSSSAYVANVEPNDWYIDTVTSQSALEPVYKVSLSWSSDVPLKLSVSGPSGLIKSYDAAYSGSGSFKTEEGSLYFTWLNPGSQNATLQYDLTPESQSEHAISTFFWGMIIVGIVVIVMIVLIVLFVLKEVGPALSGSRSSSALPPESLYPSAAAAPRMETCPGCGTKVNASTRICPGCGARVL